MISSLSLSQDSCHHGSDEQMFVREQQVPHEEQSDQEAEKFPGLKAGHQRPRGSRNGEVSATP